MAHTLRLHLAAAIRRLRHTTDHSQESFANAIDVGRSYMGQVESGKNSPTIDMLERIANGLGVEAWEVLKAATDERGPRKVPLKVMERVKKPKKGGRKRTGR